MNKWLKGSLIGGIILSIIASIIYDIAKSEPFLTGIAIIGKWIYTNVLLFAIPVWVIIVGIIICYFSYKAYRKKMANRFPTFLKFTEGMYGGNLWKWVYRQDPGSTAYRVVKIEPHCSECGENITFYEHNECFYCHDCSINYHISHDQFVAAENSIRKDVEEMKLQGHKKRA